MLEFTLVFFVNGKKITDANINPKWTLLHYLRKKLKLCGTKLGCGEGGCGACTVMVSRYDRIADRLIHMSVNACLAPVCSMHGMAVTTIEGIGSTKSRLHATQERIARGHGSQCGFCTPGIVMSMYTLLRNKLRPSEADLETTFQGNLCRCTGYRPILDAFRTFTDECVENRTKQNVYKNGDIDTNACALGAACCRNNNINGNSNQLDNEKKVLPRSEFTPYDPNQEPIFPPELILNNAYDIQYLKFIGNDVTWYRPTTLSELVQLKTQHPDAKLVVGNTEVGIEMNIKKISYPVLIQPTQIHELVTITTNNQGVVIGSAVTLQQLENVLNEEIQKHPEHKTRIFASIVYMLHWFAGKQIRNVAAVGGNIITCSPISDLNPIFTSAECELLLISKNGSRKVIMNGDFYTGYRQNIVRKDEILVSITIPYTHENQYFCALKQARRRDDDIAIVNTAISLELTPGTNIIKDIRLCFGGMAPTTVTAPKTRKLLVGRKWNEDILESAYVSLLDDLPLSPDAPGGMIQYRRALTLSLFFKAYLALSEKYSNISNVPRISENEKSGSAGFEVIHSKASQYYTLKPDSEKRTDTIGRPIVHRSAYKQATGEALYCDDMPVFENELYLTLVLSTKTHAKILSIDAKEACAIHGVHLFLSAKDLTSKQNKWGIIIQDEEIFASEMVYCQGQVIGAIVADDQLISRKAARAVKIEYEEMKPIVTIEDAIKENSYFPNTSALIVKGDVDSAFKVADYVIEGDCRTGAQEHFYLETQCTLAVPKGEDNEMEIFCSTQNPSDMNRLAASVLSVPINRLVTKVKRIGGGFGGKETRSASVALPVVLAAHKLNKPVRCMLDRNEDIMITGTRHAIFFKYKAAFTKEGNITALEMIVYLNAGYSLDVSNAVLEKVMFQCQNAYNIPNIRVRGHLCRTNLPSCVAFRGFGAPQAMFAAENMIRDVANVLEMSNIDLCRINFLKDGDITHYNQPIVNCNMLRCLDECLQMANYSTRKASIDKFNSENRWKKRGISIVPIFYGIGFSFPFMNQAGALVHVYLDGSVLLTIGGIEMGQGLHTKMIQVASRVLNIPYTDIHITETSTDKIPNATTTAGSFSSDLYGPAVINACEKISERLRPYKLKNPNNTWQQWVQAAYFDRVYLSASGFYKNTDIDYDAKTQTGHPVSYFTFGAGCTEVEIDCLTGDHNVIRTDIVMDVGESLNPAIDIGQIEGAFMQGYGMFTIEEMLYSPTGQILSCGPGTYKIPTFSDIPKEFNVSLLKGSSNPRAVYSSKAIGEPPLCLSSSVLFAIKEAVSSARTDAGITEYFHIDAPATAEKIRMACIDHITAKIPEFDSKKYTPWNVIP